MNEKTGRHQYSAEQKLLMIAPMFPHNRQHESAAQTSRGRDRQGRFCTSGIGPGRPSLNSIVRQIAAEYQVGETTIWNWCRQYRLGGYAALARRPRADKGISAILRRTPELRQMIDARLSAGMSPFAVWKSLLWVRRLHAPSYDFVLQYARGAYRPAGESPAREESVATL